MTVTPSQREERNRLQRERRLQERLCPRGPNNPETLVVAQETPRRTDGRCGHCRGFVASDTIMQAMVCINCGRVAR